MLLRRGNAQLRDKWRSLVRVGLFVVAVVAILGIAGAGVYTVLQLRPTNEPTPPVEADEPEQPRSLTQVVLGLYLSLRQADVKEPAKPGDNRQVEFSIAAGETASTIGARLEMLGLVRDAGLFSALVRYRGVDNALEAGDYVLSPSMNLEQVVSEIQNGRAKVVTVTIPEGWRLEQVAAALAKAGLGSEAEFLALMRRSDYPYPWLQERPVGAPNDLEGFLFPDTYRIPAGMKPPDVIDMMLRNFERRVTPELREKLASHGMSFYEAIVLASIVEREAVVDAERPVIAAVFLRRIEQGMYLQADPTVSYAKGYNEEHDHWWMPMQVEDTQAVVSPYNTFLHGGLTPGPICSPGLAAIEGVANPAACDYLFFVSKGDGSHAFARTFEEHLQNMEQYHNQ